MNKLYQCELCLKIYKSLEEAIKCENSNPIPKFEIHHLFQNGLYIIDRKLEIDEFADCVNSNISRHDWLYSIVEYTNRNHAVADPEDPRYVSRIFESSIVSSNWK